MFSHSGDIINKKTKLMASLMKFHFTRDELHDFATCHNQCISLYFPPVTQNEKHSGYSYCHNQINLDNLFSCWVLKFN